MTQCSCPFRQWHNVLVPRQRSMLTDLIQIPETNYQIAAQISTMEAHYSPNAEAPFHSNERNNGQWETL